MNMVELALKNRDKAPKKAFTCIDISACASLSTHATEIDYDYSYPIMDKVVSRSTNVFKMDDALINMLGALLIAIV